MESLDVVVIGAGVVGLAVARAFALRGRSVTVVESKPGYGDGVSGRSSEVIHAGIYYPTGSLKARLCVSGKESLYAYCEERGVSFRRLGKLIVATRLSELSVLMEYMDRAKANGVVGLEFLTESRVRDLEPGVETVGALRSPSSGIIDSRGLMTALVTDIQRAGGTLVFNSAVTGGSLTDVGPEIELDGSDRFSCRLVVNTAGLQAQSVAQSLGLPTSQIPALFYAKGHYFTWSGPAPFKHLVYPLADEAGLGIHATLDLGGQVRFGPDVCWAEGLDYRFDEGRRSVFAKAIKRYFPACDESQLRPAYVGIRPKIVGPGQGAADFQIQTPDDHGRVGLINLFGIESPGLTSCLAIADYVLIRAL